MSSTLTGQQFQRRLRNLILLAWTLPPIFGLSTLLYIDLFTPRQILDILSNLLEPVFNIGWIVFAGWYLPRLLRPVSDYLDKPGTVSAQTVLKLLRRFPLYFWVAFLLYLVLAPTTVMFSAVHYSDYIATPVSWFRIHLVALIVSIIVGLPIFFLILDLFGKIIGSLQLRKPHITLKTKVFMIGALTPLLIDTMLVQYYWTRTGYFTTETFFVWLTLELLAVGGSVIFVRSISQSLSPLQELFSKNHSGSPNTLPVFSAKSTDELGVITTDYRRLLEELYANRYELEHQVLLRTQELTTINKELEAFAHSVSHDLRAPLRSINGFAHILMDNYARDLDEEACACIQRIVDSSARMSQIIDALLRLSRVTRAGLEREALNLSRLASDILDMHKQDAPERVIEIRIQPKLTVFADKNLTQILLDNLLNNALKFSSPRKHAVIEFGQISRDSQRFFYVKDNGVGFDMRFADKLFTAFQRLHSEQEFEGVGIGLATVRRIVDLHGGQIWVEAAPDQGATVYFSL